MDIALVLDAFHFIRPWVLVLLPLVAFAWWQLRAKPQTNPAMADALAPHLRDALTLGAAQNRTLQPIDGVCAILALAVLGAAGPTWSRVPDPFAAQTAPLVVVMEVSTSMDADDVAPTRLERGKQKVLDLLDDRAGASTALVAYAGTAHRVVPLTEDAGIMRPYLEGLTSAIMPDDGDNATAALDIALGILEGEDAAGGVLFISDNVASSDAAALGNAKGVTVAVLSMLPEGSADQALDNLGNVQVVRVTPDRGDIRQIQRGLNAAYQRALLEDESQDWDDRGRWLALPAALLALLWFRRGWTMQWAMTLALTMGLLTPSQSQAQSLADLFFTPDQQGQLAYSRKRFGAAAEHFTDPLWQGYAHFRNARYAEAEDALSRLDTPEANYTRGLALLRNRKYREGVRAFEAVLEADPDYPGAAENLETAKEIVTFVENVQAQSDTGEDTGIGADETVFDNESGMGQETEITGDTGPEILSTEQWMNTVNTQTGDFLRQRFLLETSGSQ